MVRERIGSSPESLIKAGGKFWNSQLPLYFIPALSGFLSSHTYFAGYLYKELNFSIKLVVNECAYLWCCELSCWAVSNSDTLWNHLNYISSWWTKMKAESVQVNSVTLLYISAISKLKNKFAVLGMLKICRRKYKQSLWDGKGFPPLKYNSNRNCAVVKVLERLELSCSIQGNNTDTREHCISVKEKTQMERYRIPKH